LEKPCSSREERRRDIPGEFAELRENVIHARHTEEYKRFAEEVTGAKPTSWKQDRVSSGVNLEHVHGLGVMSHGLL